MLTQTCADMCLAAVKAMSSNNKFVKEINKLCADICIACANECNKYEYIQHCKECKEACRKCAYLCKTSTNAYSYN